MYALDKIVLLPSIQRISESLSRLLGLDIGVIDESGDICWLGTTACMNQTERIELLRKLAAERLQILMENPTVSAMWNGPDESSGIGVPVFENARCTAMVFGAFFKFESEMHGNMPVISRREARLALDMLMEIASEIRENAPVLHPKRETADYQCNFTEILGSSMPMKALLNELELVCSNETPVLIQGDQGTGKQLIAKTIHLNSRRKTRPFIFIDCASMTESRLESELFGHKRGAFNGAMTDQPGMLDIANGGTILLNNVHALSETLQFKLLKLMECGSFLPQGDTIPHSVNIRVIASSCENIENLCGQGKFRVDLFYRLGIMQIHVPTLAERREDIAELVEYGVSKVCQMRQIPVKTVHPDAIRILENYDWPGNLDELECEIERLVAISTSENEICPTHIHPRIFRTQSVKADALQAISHLQAADSLSDDFRLVPGQNLQDAMAEIERRIIALTLKQQDGNRTKTAEILGISRRNLIRKIETLGIEMR